MSNEFEKSGEGSQPKSQPAAPFYESAALAPASVRGAEPGTDPAKPLPSAADARVGPPEAVWCSQCAADVVPSVPNHCPDCGGWVFNNLGALSTGVRSKQLRQRVDQYRVDLIEQMYAERGGRAALDVASRIAIENYALVCASHKMIEQRLDSDGLFTQTGRRRSAFDMLRSITETIDRLRAQLPLPATEDRSGSNAGIAAMPTSALLLTRDLLTRQEKGETLSDRELGALDVLRGAMRGELLLPPGS